MRYEISAKIPTMIGACPSIFLSNAKLMYDGWSQSAQISIMEWKHHFGGNCLVLLSITISFNIQKTTM